MDVRCDKCQARYRIDDARVGPSGLTMRCGKCSNTFKVTKDGTAAPVAVKPAPAAPSAPPPSSDMPGSTMMFQAPKSPPSAAKSAPKAAPSVPAPPSLPATPASGEMPGSTVLFQAPKAAPVSAPPPAASSDVAGSTMMFQAPKLPPAAAKTAPKAVPAPVPAKAAPVEGSEDSGSTMMFGTAPVKPQEAKPLFVPPPVVADDEHAGGDEETAGGKEDPNRAQQDAPDGEELDPGDDSTSDEPVNEPVQAKPGEVVGDDDIDPSAMTGESRHVDGDSGAHPPPRKPAGSKGAIYLAAIAAVAVLVLGVIAFIVWDKVRVRAPSAAALQTMQEARKTMEKDSLASFQQALDTDASAIAAAPKSPFAEAHALQSEIELAWSDALADQAQLLADKSARTYDEKQKQDADAGSQKAAQESKIHFKNAFDSAKGANTLAPTSAEVHLALADYYRAAKSNSNYDREMKKAAAFKADESRLLAIEGARLLGEDDGADKALGKLKPALAADPQNAAIQYRIAQAQALLKNEAEEKKALEATLKLSPSHERAKLMLDALTVAEQTPKANAQPQSGQ